MLHCCIFLSLVLEIFANCFWEDLNGNSDAGSNNGPEKKMKTVVMTPDAAFDGEQVGNVFGQLCVNEGSAFTP